MTRLRATDRPVVGSGLSPKDELAVPFAQVVVTAGGEQAVLDVMRRGWLTTGPETQSFESELADWIGARHAVAVSSCTIALELSLRALRLPPGSPVLTPTMTFCGAVHAIVHAGLQPVLVDIDEESLVMSVEDTERAARKFGAAAMVVQHMGGYPAPVPELAAAAGLPLDCVVEDAAHGIGASLDGRSVGRISRATCFSFYATKNLPLGEGGAITTDDSEFAGRLRRLQLHGMSHDAWRRYQPGAPWAYDVEDVGLKANMTDLTAALGRVQLRHLSAWQTRRAELADRYSRQLEGVPGLRLPARPATGTHAWHLYAVRLTAAFPLSRDAVAEVLRAAGIGTSVHFIPVHHFSYSGHSTPGWPPRRLPVADAAFPQLLSLPLHPHLSDQQVDRVCAELISMGRWPTPDIQEGRHAFSTS